MTVVESLLVILTRGFWCQIAALIRHSSSCFFLSCSIPGLPLSVELATPGRGLVSPVRFTMGLSACLRGAFATTVLVPSIALTTDSDEAAASATVEQPGRFWNRHSYDCSPTLIPMID